MFGSSSTRRLALTIWTWALLATPLAFGQAASSQGPFVSSIIPRGARQGASVGVTIRGTSLGLTEQITLSGDGVKATVLDATETQVCALITVAADAALGLRDLRVIGPAGSFVQIFEVGNLPESTETEPNNEQRTASRVAYPVMINGVVLPEDYDHFRFTVEARQELVFDLRSSRVGTRVDGMLTLIDAQGRRIADQDDYYFDKDARLVHRFAEAGEYTLRLNGFRDAGAANAEYRLLISDGPDLSYVFPAGGRRGSTVEVEVSGVNLDKAEGWILDGRPLGTTVLDKSSHRLKLKIDLPADIEPGLRELKAVWDAKITPKPLTFVVSDAEETVARRYEDSPLEAPVVVNGVIEEPGQKDTFVIEARAGETYVFDGAGMKLGNFIDPAILLYDVRGELVAYLDETAPNCFGKEPPSVDFYLVHRFEQSGRYRVVLRDAGLRGDPSFVYRLGVRRAAPDFYLTALGNQVTVTQGGRASFLARVRRLGGWNKPVDVWVEGLPSGVTSKKVTAGPENTRYRGVFGEDFFLDGTNVELLLEGTPEAPLGTWPLIVRARGEMDGKVVEHSATVLYPWQKTGYMSGPAREQQLLLTLAEPPRADENPPQAEIATR
jgi:hypothetical protein